ncbi:allophanate hydrolase-related protein [Hwanghaeella sp.]|uniref:allophanate hydrolase-related protein n=1 Tax=Hwanghaeella sp. TaxID=2605943 RepID=UPI003CCBC58E
MMPDAPKTTMFELSLDSLAVAIVVEAFGSFAELIPRQLGIGTEALANGLQVKGFICEPTGIAAATEITQYGRWRSYCAETAAWSA